MTFRTGTMLFCLSYISKFWFISVWYFFFWHGIVREWKIKCHNEDSFLTWWEYVRIPHRHFNENMFFQKASYLFIWLYLESSSHGFIFWCAHIIVCMKKCYHANFCIFSFSNYEICTSNWEINIFSNAPRKDVKRRLEWAYFFSFYRKLWSAKKTYFAEIIV